MALWQIRVKKDSFSVALDQGLVFIGWDDLPDLSTVSSQEGLAIVCSKTYPLEKPGTITNWVRQLWAFREKIQLGDLVMVPLKTSSNFAIGRIIGPYEYKTNSPFNIHHIRSVEWIRIDIPRLVFEQDILNSLGSILSVCQIKRNNAEERIQAILSKI